MFCLFQPQDIICTFSISLKICYQDLDFPYIWENIEDTKRVTRIYCKRTKDKQYKGQKDVKIIVH